MPGWFLAAAALVSVFAGATASVVGFGIGSLLTPLLATRMDLDLAVAAVALPHLAAGLLRGWRLRGSVSVDVLRSFGVLSAAGGLAGALVFAHLAPAPLGRILGALLLLTATAAISGWTEAATPGTAVVWILGGLSGFFGGLIGNQGGLRAAALTALSLEPAAFVATSTVVGVMIDLVRTPVYLYREATRLPALAALCAVLTAGVLAGTLAGEHVLLGMSRERFRGVVALAIGILGLWFLLRPA
ncbi:MAG TPA: sulfite exporter TauE/SafE family protein [Candidatus Binatia bacterium]|jgi:uncharacterized membrane protein YfcA